jgi:hypothetical protein
MTARCYVWLMETTDIQSREGGVSSDDARSALVEWFARAFPNRLGLSLDEFAESLSYSRGHVKNLVAAQRVRVHRAGRRVVIPMDAAIDFMLLEDRDRPTITS